MVITFSPFSLEPQRSPSSNGTRTTSAEPIPSEQHLARLNLILEFYRQHLRRGHQFYFFHHFSQSGNSFRSSMKQVLRPSSTYLGNSCYFSAAASATTFPFTEITGFLASIKAEAAALIALNQTCLFT